MSSLLAHLKSAPQETSGRPALLTVLLLGMSLHSVAATAAQTPLEHSEVVFMYQANREIYEAYGATMVAWGGRPDTASLNEARGLRFFGSVGMVTEFAQYHSRYRQDYEQGLCRDVQGNPVKVPWLTDHQHEGVPFWWCCTQQPLFRQYLRDRVSDTVKAGAYGVHVDDHLGTAGGLWLGLCYCDRCVVGFRDYLRGLPGEELARLGVQDANAFDYRAQLRDRMQAKPDTKPNDSPLFPHWRAYQCQAAAKFMAELRETAAQAAGRTVPMSANAGLLWPLHLADYPTLDFFSCEVDHHAPDLKISDLPLFAYRLADAVDRPLAATASGGDWAFIKEKNLPGLVGSWIATAYSAGHYLMVPHHQWCYTKEKGTHWYDGPKEKFAPLFQHVRQNRELFDGYEPYADLAVVVPHRSFVRQPQQWFDLVRRLSEAGLAYRILLAGDEIVPHPLPLPAMAEAQALLLPNTTDLLMRDKVKVDLLPASPRHFANVDQALSQVKPAIVADRPNLVRVFPRVKNGRASVHLVNRDYDAAQDGVKEIKGIKLTVRAKSLGLDRLSKATFFAPGAAPRSLQINGETLSVETLGLWATIVLE